MKKLNKNKKLFVFIALQFGLAGLAHADNIVLDVQQAVERANNTDPRISEKEKLVDVGRGLLLEAQGAESWIFDVNTFVGLAPDVKGGVFEDDEGNLKIDSDALDFDGVSPWYNLQLSIIYPISTFGKAEGYANAAENNIRIQQGEVTIQKGKTYLDVLTAYYGYLASRDAVYMLEDANKKVDSAIELVQGWLDEGNGGAKQSDLFALQTGSGILNRYLEQARGLQNIAEAGLRLLTGIDKKDTIELADQKLTPVPLPDKTLDDLQKTALENRPEMVQVEAGLNARRALLSAKQSEAYPNFYWGLVGSFAYSPNRPRLDELSIFDPFNHYGATPIIGFKWDWWTGRQEGQVKQAEGEYNALIEKKSFAQRGIPFQVAEQYHNVQSYHKMVQHLYNAARAGRRWMLASYADFEAGVEKAEKVMTAFQGYVLAYSDYLQIVNNYNLHVGRLHVVTGDLK